MRDRMNPYTVLSIMITAFIIFMVWLAVTGKGVKEIVPTSIEKEILSCENKGGVYLRGRFGAARCEFPPINNE